MASNYQTLWCMVKNCSIVVFYPTGIVSCLFYIENRIHEIQAGLLIKWRVWTDMNVDI